MALEWSGNSNKGYSLILSPFLARFPDTELLGLAPATLLMQAQVAPLWLMGLIVGKGTMFPELGMWGLNHIWPKIGQSALRLALTTHYI